MPKKKTMPRSALPLLRWSVGPQTASFTQTPATPHSTWVALLLASEGVKWICRQVSADSHQVTVTPGAPVGQDAVLWAGQADMLSTGRHILRVTQVLLHYLRRPITGVLHAPFGGPKQTQVPRAIRSADVKDGDGVVIWIRPLRLIRRSSV